jgi:intracellular multiplication protein IcmJ|nr:HNH endonuclease [Neorhizobium tomejilense]
MSKQQLPLFLSVKALNWRANDRNSHEHDAEFQRVRKKALDRDNHTCRFCGFRNNKWQEVHHFNDDHADNRLENLITTCPYCHMCQHIGLAGANKEAILIYRPELSQVQINHLVRTAQIAERIYDSMRAEQADQVQNKKNANLKTAQEAAEMAKTFMAALKSSADGARAMLGTSEPVDLANALLLLPDEAYARRRESLRGIRLLPLGVRMSGSDNQMLAMVESWRMSSQYSNLQPSSWKALVHQYC